MARVFNRLKPAQIHTLGPGRHHDGLGLYLVVGEGTARSWIFRFYRGGKLRHFGLGPAHTVKLAAARQACEQLRLGLRAGIDPIEVRRAERSRVVTPAKRLLKEHLDDRTA
jgi:hypothetical protein